MTEALIRNEQARLILNSLSANICLLDPEGFIVEVNQAWLDFARENGADPERTVFNVNYLDIADQATGPESSYAHRFAAGIRSVMRGEQDFFELEMPCHSPGEERWFVGRVTPFPYGRRRGAVVAHENITQRKLMERDLRESELKFRTYLQDAPVGILVADDNGRFVETNPEASRITGYSPEELNGLSFSDLVDADHEQEAWLQARDLEQRGRAQRVLRIKRQDGSRGWVNVVAVRLLQNRYLSFVTDITHMKEAEREILRSQRLLEGVLNAIPDVIGVQKPDYTVLRYNEAGYRFLGKEPREAKGEKCYRLLGREEPCVPCTTANALQAGCLQEMERYLPEWDMFLETRANPVFNEQGQVEYVVEQLRDITARKRAEQKIKEYARRLEETQAQLNREIEQARALHERTFLREIPEVGGLRLAAHFQPAQQLGGDFFNFIRSEDQLIVCLSDVSGHGLDGTLISVFVKESIKNLVSLHPGAAHPESLLRHIHAQYLRENYPSDYFISLFLAVLDLNSFALRYTGAGMHIEPLVRLGDGTRTRLKSSGPPISTAIPGELMDFETKHLTLTPGSTALFFTDGIAEQAGENGMYARRLEQVFFCNAHQPAEQVKEAINADFQAFNQGSLQAEDDVTYIVLQREA